MPDKDTEENEISPTLLHVHDLPQLYTEPPSSELLSTLDLLSKSTNGFEFGPHQGDASRKVCIDPTGITRYLTDIIASPLDWLTETEREEVWEEASKRLSERSGRNAAPSMTRTFRINPELELQLYEPSLTEDNLGLKTWASSLLMSQRLDYFSSYIPRKESRLLELGAGTGLVGLAAACLWQSILSEVVLTDLPDIVPNLQKNVTHNIQMLSQNHSELPLVTCRVLDWSDELDGPSSDEETFSIIAAADPIYSSDHPRMLTDTVRRWLRPSSESRFIVQLPLREGYAKERDDLKSRLGGFMTIVQQGEDVGFDDWLTADGQPAEVTCWWSIWQLIVPS